MSDNVRRLPAKFSDVAMFEAAPHDNNYRPDMGVVPRVHLLSMNHDPLGDLASFVLMYKGEPVTDLERITDEQRRWAWDEAMSTHLKAPFEVIKLHFMLDGVDRAFTHQHVRQRTAVYAQESLRFAVVDDLGRGTTLPPSLYGTRPMNDVEYEDLMALSPEERKQQEMRDVWDDALVVLGDAYRKLIEMGMTAEDARGLLPQATSTRIHYSTDLRNLADQAGNRLCTQAQFHWRNVFGQIVQSIRTYGRLNNQYVRDAWQFELIADSMLFRPVCYQRGECPWKGDLDRKCSIRERVDKLSEAGVPPQHWHMTVNGSAIDNTEWLLDPDAAKKGYKPKQGDE